MSGEETRRRALEAARAWIGTPYRHRASTLGVGADCLGLVRGVWRALYGAEPETLPVYGPLWAELGGREAMQAALARHMTPLALAEAEAGDVMLFRFRAHLPAKHAAVLSGGDLMIHAYGERAVAETPLGAWWRRRRAFAFRFPVCPLRPCGAPPP